MPPALTPSEIDNTRSLLHDLYTYGEGDKKLSKLLKHTDHIVPSSATSRQDERGKEYRLTSWKMQDYMYKRDPCPYPTRARGLFTLGKERIVARAYDKFFNVGEVSWTKVILHVYTGFYN